MASNVISPSPINGTRKNIRGTKDYRIYFLNLHLDSVPDLSSVRVNGRSIHIYKPEKYESMHTKLLSALSNREFCSDVGSYGIEILNKEHGYPDFAVVVESKASREVLGLAISMAVWHEDYNNTDYPRDPESLYIEVLCGSSKLKGVGSILLDALAAIAQSLDKSQLELTATPSSKSFYEHVGFTCGGPRGYNCLKPVYAGGKRKTRRRRSKPNQ